MKKIILILFTFFSTNLIFSQQEISAFFGTAIFHGDVGYNSLKIGNTNKLFENSEFSWGISFRNNFNERFSVNVSFKKGKVSSFDSQSEDLFIVTRNLDFQSKISEMSANIEYNFSHYKIGSQKFNKAFYVFSGISGFKFNPKGLSNEGTWVDLQPLGTEGQGSSIFPDTEKYSLYGIGIPIGLGYKINLNKNIALNMSWSWTLTFTDYIDDVSTQYVNPSILSPIAQELADKSFNGFEEDYQRGNSQNNDKFGFVGLSIVYKIPRKSYCSDISFF
tara:strand:- start:250 stop:1077 length:828 start_codon:yes stop_codon:yes gene_type:complete